MALPKGGEGPTEEPSVNSGSSSRWLRDGSPLLTACLRGVVGRGKETQTWVLVLNPKPPPHLKRLRDLEQVSLDFWASAFFTHSLGLGEETVSNEYGDMLETWHNSIFIIVHCAWHSHRNEVTLHRSGKFISLRVTNSKDMGPVRYQWYGEKGWCTTEGGGVETMASPWHTSCCKRDWPGLGSPWAMKEWDPKDARLSNWQGEGGVWFFS